MGEINDIENFIFDQIAKKLQTVYPGISVISESEAEPASFPAVTIVEAANSVYQKMRTTKIENATQLMYEVNVYCNTIGYKKLEARSIMATIDDLFADMGFMRTMMNPMANLHDATIYRLFARYTGIDKPEIDQDGNIIHRIYTQ